jgi:hypothetical protein
MNDNYLKPVCECGGEIGYIQEIVYERGSNINRNGFPNKSKQYINSAKLENGIGWLECKECKNEYEIIWYMEERLIRGRRR